MSRPADRAQDALLRALGRVTGPFAIVAVRSTPWWSATFEGTRHRLVLYLEGADAIVRAERLPATLAETELPMRGAFVADIVATGRSEGGAPVLEIETLTIQEAADAPAVVSRAGRRGG